ncbi:hypothetical protein TRAPUB_12781 [Trametes pubescens]|uniref:Uncharacterized protein n=1 Tax=Trametes pubescens TaxID=154538 RepID=A0A1M2VT03_TRAPU|nr:hypothetical protein TRAPUB_12781 [Trametes pubescens]
MGDKDFERTVEELYAHGKDDASAPGPGPGTQTHVLELQPRGASASKGTDGSVSAQPAPRPSMEAPPRPSLEERVPGEPRAERRDRTREWVHAHSASEPGVDAVRARSRPRSKSQADGIARGGQGPKTPGGSMRAPGKEGRAALPSDAQAYVQSWKRSQDGGPREGVVDGQAGAEAVPVIVSVPSLHREESLRTRREAQERQEEEERSGRSGTSPPRLDIPASLQPGRPSSWTPSQLQLEPQAASGQAGAAP